MPQAVFLGRSSWSILQQAAAMLATVGGLVWLLIVIAFVVFIVLMIAAGRRGF